MFRTRALWKKDAMNQYNRTTYDAGALDTSRDEGLRSFMLGVYNKMGLGLVVTGILAWVAFSVPAVSSLLYVTDPATGGLQFTLLGTVLRFAPIGILLISMFAMRNPSPIGANLLYWGLVATFGIGASLWFFLYSLTSITQVFFITAAAFFALSLYGYTTKKNLQAFGSFLIMAVVGLIGAVLVNMFLGSGLLAMIISVAGVGIFGALTAFDTQRLKLQYVQIAGDERSMAIATTFGALSLYINFINMFQFLLMLLGNRE
jgi:FtsH-binding integral membrane protein